MKLVQKLSLNMRHKDDLGPTDEGELDVFQLSRITSENVGVFFLFFAIMLQNFFFILN